jgi:hypothetical protein
VIGRAGLGTQEKLLEIDTLMTPAEQRVVHEVHPEVSCEMNGGQPLLQRKNTLMVSSSVFAR